MNRDQTHRFETEIMPRIAEGVARVVDQKLRVEIIPGSNAHEPARLRVSAPPSDQSARTRRYPFDMNVVLTWDDEEIERLLRPGGDARLQRYLDVLGEKLRAWQDAREVDVPTRSQAEPSVLLGGLDFEA
ncbi:DUF5594 family protein [Caballeronia sp. LZ062]|uniref:DUF5594 family protein n=1 Tax=unclassified Caballeronia TaxID=2646786 RepID=UPI002857EA8D|nr:MULTISPECIES: DUF5594 family protein [unclassified Caballeronia]MDR5854414.1 DUF5594 family protein [Caballeronia sp. LZ050]MDR5871055.1 DUF5594 family protein [Caballeronia sp. LZ062]